MGRERTGSATAGHAPDPLTGLLGYGRRHCWFDPPLQAHRTSCVPLVVLRAGSSKHLPEAGLTNCPLTACHCWLPPPLQGHHSMSVPLAELFPVISRQPPLMVQLCAPAKPLQSTSVPCCLASRHRCCRPRTWQC